MFASRAASAKEWCDKARRAEALGYSTLLMPDHLGPQLAPIPALTAAALATERLRVGSFVFANDYRNPVMLAKEAATLDLLSGGRLDLGLGAGWATRDYENLGIPYDPPKVRVDRMSEALRLMKRLFTEEEVSFEGRHYRVRGARLAPRPMQRPHPPIMVAGGGPRMLRIAAREADIVGLTLQVTPRGRPYVDHVTVGATAKKVALVREAAGERFERLELNAIVFDAQVTGTRHSVAVEVAGRMKAAVADVIESPYFLFGSLEEIRRDLLAHRERLGITYFAIPDHAMEDFAPLVHELSGA